MRVTVQMGGARSVTVQRIKNPLSYRKATVTEGMNVQRKKARQLHRLKNGRRTGEDIFDGIQDFSLFSFGSFDNCHNFGRVPKEANKK